jgi:hypothetical protein
MEYSMFNKLIKILIFLWTFGLGINSSFATLIVSGDASIVDPLNKAFGKYYNPDNQRFFSNILQGGDHVAVLDQLNSSDLSHEKSGKILSFYSTLSMVTTNDIQSITETALQDVDLLVVPLPETPFSTDELSYLNSFYDNGGSVFFLGDGYSIAGDGVTGIGKNQNAHINDALADLGSLMRIDDNMSFDFGLPVTASGSRIASSILTSGVTSLTYGYASGVTGGTPLFLASDNITPFIECDLPIPVPEPSTLLLSLTGLLFLFGFAKGKKGS